MPFMKVCRVDDVWEGDMEVFEVGGTRVLIVHSDGGEVIATQTNCPHQEVELVEGGLDGNVLTCRMHLWEFDVSTCRGINPDHSELARYPVRIDGDDIFVDPTGDQPRFAH